MFNIKQLARAQQAEKDGFFEAYHGDALHAPAICANLLDYQLAVTSYKVELEENVFEIFRRINSSGRQLSSQEQRQAGVLCPFSDLVRGIAAEIRGGSRSRGKGLGYYVRGLLPSNRRIYKGFTII